MTEELLEKEVDFNPFETKPLEELEEKKEEPVEQKPVIEEKKIEEIKPTTTEEKPETKILEKPIAQKQEDTPVLAELDPTIKEKFYSDTYEILAQKKELEKVAGLDVTKVPDAKKVLELSLKIKNVGLDETEIRDEIADKYAYPKQPKQKADEEDPEYQERLDEWKEKVEKIDKRMSRDAKSALPEILKRKSELVLPEIPKYAQLVAKKEPSQEELAQFETLRTEYLSSIGLGVDSLNEFSVTSTNKDVPLTVAWKVEQAEKDALKTRFTDFDSNEFLQSRWLTKEGKFNGAQQAKDVYVLENFEKIIQKQVNDAINQMQLHNTKTQKNIDIENVPRGTFKPEASTESDKMAEFFFSS